MDRVQQNKLKTSISAISVSVILGKYRKQEDIISHTGLMQIDIDEISVEEAYKVKETLIQDPYTFSCFYSPSGKIKMVVKVIPDLNLHKAQFNELVHYYKDKYNITCDESVKDVNRLMYYSWDPDIYYNPNSLQFKDHSSIKKTKKEHKLDENQNDAIQVIELIEIGSVDITGSHNDWIKIIYSLIDIFGEKCAEYIHRISRYYPTYDFSETQSKIEACLQSNGEGITKDTFFYYAKKSGISLNNRDKNKKSSSSINEAKKQNSNLNKFVLAKIYLSEKYLIRSNEVTLDLEYKKKETNEPYEVLNENNIFIELQEDGLNISISNLLALLRSDFVKKHDPFISYFTNLPPWDGIDHIENLSNYVKAKDQKFFNYHFKKWLVRTVKCAIEKKYFNKQSMTLVSDIQNNGKTTFCRFLCPPVLSPHIAENISVDKDSRIALAKNFLINQDELSMMSRLEINALKSMISQEQINERLPYDRKNSIIPRRASFMGSTNQTEFLTDESGSVRWLCFEIDSIDWNYSKIIDINEVWAQAYHLLRSGKFAYDLSVPETEEIQKRNKTFYSPTIEQTIIEHYFKPSASIDEKYFFTPKQLTMRILIISNNKFSFNPVTVGKALKFLGYKRLKNSKFDVWGYYIEEIR